MDTVFKRCVFDGPSSITDEEQSTHEKELILCEKLGLKTDLNSRRIQLLGNKLFSLCARRQPVDAADLTHRTELLNARLQQIGYTDEELKLTTDDLVSMCKLHDTGKSINRHIYDIMSSEEEDLAAQDALEESGVVAPEIAAITRQYLDEYRSSDTTSYPLSGQLERARQGDPQGFYPTLFQAKTLLDNVELVGDAMAYQIDDYIKQIVDTEVRDMFGRKNANAKEPLQAALIQRLKEQLIQQIKKTLFDQEISSKERTVHQLATSRDYQRLLDKNIFPTPLSLQQKDAIVEFLARYIPYFVLIAFSTFYTSRYKGKNAALRVLDWLRYVIQESLYTNADFLFDYPEFLQQCFDAFDAYIKKVQILPSDKLGFDVYKELQQQLALQGLHEPSQINDFVEEYLDSLSYSQRYNYNMFVDKYVLDELATENLINKIMDKLMIDVMKRYNASVVADKPAADLAELDTIIGEITLPSSN